MLVRVFFNKPDVLSVTQPTASKYHSEKQGLLICPNMRTHNIQYVNQALIDAGNVCAEADVIITIHSITIRVLYIYSVNLFPFPCTKLSAAGTEIIIR